MLARAALAVRAGRIAEPERERLAQTLVEVEREGGPSVLLLVALIQQESRFDPRARGPRGSLGLMQVRPFVGEEVAARIAVPWQGERTLLDPVANVRIGAGYLAELMDRFYRHLKNDSSKDRALREAQLELIRDPLPVTDGHGQTGELDASHPYHWAAFQLIGDWR